MTETTNITLFYYPEADDTGSIGKLMANSDIKYGLWVINLMMIADFYQTRGRGRIMT